MPIEFPEEASGYGAWRTFVLSAGLADAVSRSVTAPIDRLKTQFQVRSTQITDLCTVGGFIKINPVTSGIPTLGKPRNTCRQEWL